MKEKLAYQVSFCAQQTLGVWRSSVGGVSSLVQSRNRRNPLDEFPSIGRSQVFMPVMVRATTRATMVVIVIW